MVQANFRLIFTSVSVLWTDRTFGGRPHAPRRSGQHWPYVCIHFVSTFYSY